MFTKTDIERYFTAEKSESLVFIILGAIAIILAIVLFFFVKASWHKGAAIPFFVVGIIQLAACVAVYKRSDADRMRLVYAYDMNPPELNNKELPRMEKVNKTFVILKIGEITLLLAGLLLFFYFKNDTTKAFWMGLGLALAIEAGITLGGDIVAHTSAKKYLKGLQSFAVKK